MTGQKIKDILRSEGITIADVARMLGHNGDQRLHSALKSEDVKSGLIEDIARVTNKSVCYFYEGSGNTVATDHGIAVSGDSNQINALSEKFIEMIEKKDEQMDRLIGIIEKKRAFAIFKLIPVRRIVYRKPCSGRDKFLALHPFTLNDYLAKIQKKVISG